MGENQIISPFLSWWICFDYFPSFSPRSISHLSQVVFFAIFFLGPKYCVNRFSSHNFVRKDTHNPIPIHPHHVSTITPPIHGSLFLPRSGFPPRSRAHPFLPSFPCDGAFLYVPYPAAQGRRGVGCPLRRSQISLEAIIFSACSYNSRKHDGHDANMVILWSSHSTQNYIQKIFSLYTNFPPDKYTATRHSVTRKNNNALATKNTMITVGIRKKILPTCKLTAFHIHSA